MNDKMDKGIGLVLLIFGLSMTVCIPFLIPVIRNDFEHEKEKRKEDDIEIGLPPDSQTQFTPVDYLIIKIKSLLS